MDDDEAAFFSKPRKKIIAPPPRKRKRTNIKEAALKSVESDAATDSDSDVSATSAATTKKPTTTTVRSTESTILAKRDVGSDVITLESDSDGDLRAGRVHNDGSKSLHGARKTRPRRRSDSLTPPPQLSPRRRLAGTQIIKNAFRTTSNILSSDLAIPTVQPDEAELLFEEQMRQRALAERPAGRANGSPKASLSRQGSELTRNNSDAMNDIPDSIVEIVIRGVHVEIPKTTSIITDIASWETPRLLRIRLNTKFSIAKIGFCKEAGLSSIENGVKVVTSSDLAKIGKIVLAHKGVRVFDHVTPHSLGIVDGDQPYLEAFTKEGWQCLEQFPDMRKAQSTSSGQQNPKHSGSAQKDSPTNQESDPKVGDTTRLTLRSSDGRELKIRTRPTTKITSIIAGFRKNHAIAESIVIELRFEGEILEGTMADHEIEDEDVVDVKIYN